MVEENLNLEIKVDGADQAAKDIKKVGDATVDMEEKITDAYRDRIKAMMDIERVSDSWIRQNKKQLDVELELWESQQKGADQNKKNATLFGKLEERIKGVSVRKEQLVSIMGQLATGNMNAASSIGTLMAGFGTAGLMAGGLGLALADIAIKAIETVEANKRLAASFIQSSDAMKEMGYGAVGYQVQLDEIIKKNREIGVGIAHTGEAGGGGRVSSMVETAIANLTVQMAAQGKTHEEITKALKDNKSKIEDYAKATEAVTQAQKELDKVFGNDQIAQLKRKELTEALNTAIAHQKDTMDEVTTAFGGLVPAINSLQSYFYNLRTKISTAAAIIPGMTAEESRKIMTGARRGVKPEEVGGGAAKIPIKAWEQTEAQRYAEWQLQLEAPGLYTGIKETPKKPIIEGLGDKKAQDTFGKDLAQTTTTSMITGMVAAAQAQEPRQAFKDMFLGIFNTVLNTIISKGVRMMFNPLGLSTGGYLQNGTWRRFEKGGSDFGSWVGSPMAIAGRRNNAIIGDVAGGEVVQNMPQIANMIKAVASATAGSTNNYYMQGLIGQQHVNDGVRVAYRDSSARQGKVTR